MFQKKEPLITFALSCGTLSSPRMFVYSVDDIYKELQSSTSLYLQHNIQIDLLRRRVWITIN